MAENFGRLLEELGICEDGGHTGHGEPYFKVSAGVGFTVLTLSPMKETNSPRKIRNYGEMPEEPRIEPQLSLAELTSRTSKATSMSELRRLRREFALIRHPDQNKGAAAACEMAAANRLIDDAIDLLRKRLPAQPGMR